MASGENQQALTVWIFLRALALVYLCAFLSLATQILGLVGSRGILPADQLLQAVAKSEGLSRYWDYPTLAWINCSDTALVALCWLGIALSALLILGLAPRLVLLGCWLSYLSLATVCQDFLWFQWDSLLLECSLLALFVAPLRRSELACLIPPPKLGIFLLRWLLFRVMFASAVMKLTSGDPTWRSLTALNFHYQTQPLPMWTAWYAHGLPEPFHHASVLAMFAIEGPCAFLIFAPRRFRLFGAFALATLQILILLTGNYGFFNLLVLALCLLLLDDRVWPEWLRQRCRIEGAHVPSRARRISSLSVAALLLWLSAMPILGAFQLNLRLFWPAPELVQVLAPFRVVNRYGLFAVMTTARQELIIEGSADGTHFIAYEFQAKPGDPSERPKFVTPHMPRLDWQLWFAALGSLPDAPWVSSLCQRLLEGAPEVVSLFRQNPFPQTPPRFVRVTLYNYRFTTQAEHQKTGAWWIRQKLGAFSPVYRQDGYGW